MKLATTGRSVRARAGAVVVLAATLLSGCGTAEPTTPEAVPSGAASASARAAAPPTTPAPDPATRPPATVPDVPLRQATAAPAAPRDPAPRFLTVEGTSISMEIVDVGASPDGAMEIPESVNQAGWYRYGPAPGAVAGAAVIAAHVDTTSDRAPFSQLRRLPAGTLITVERYGAPSLDYRVRSVELMAKDRFDGGSLFRRDGPHQLRLVTCGGRWLDERQDYSDNVIVTAEPE
ncbi:hypothetical protein QF038_002184 [Pseudarthrobacter sp. W1I19]|uniref:class F sortase n=1 Tax=Pseudarthrobacter sp. W1I19 TaxID=3042288 RepID=UPI002789F037|nr:class F sortase [Pseudarthrobacter sp. W1I19]MDQ0923676.1 hypothetical protein [Pseudarthrobacter sp. W1I19]